MSLLEAIAAEAQPLLELLTTDITRVISQYFRSNHLLFPLSLYLPVFPPFFITIFSLSRSSPGQASTIVEIN